MKERLLTSLAIIATILSCIFSRSCANTTTPPSGGLKDTIPPVLIKVLPENNTTGFPLHGGKISLTYNEYTIIKSATDIYLSPPGKRKPIAKVKGKDILVTLKDTLKENTTYTIDFGNSLADNNEGNIAPRMVYTFSTGNEIDSMYCTGTVLDCKTLLPAKNVLVALYEDFSDSACFNLYPVAAGKCDEWGYFVIRNIKPKKYMIYAYTDQDNDSRYSPESDMIAFRDSIFVPFTVVRDSIYELGSFSPKDTVKCLDRESQINLIMFKEFHSIQYLKNKGMINKRMGFLTFSAPDAEIISLQILGIDSTDIITQYTPVGDSMNFWIKSNYQLEDSLFMRLQYMKTDSTGILSKTEETVSLALKKEFKTEELIKKEKADTVITLKIIYSPETVEQSGIRMVFGDPVLQLITDSILFIATNPKNQNDTIPFNFTQDSTDLRIYTIQAKEEYKAGYKYSVQVPAKIFTDIYNRSNAKSELNFSLPNSEKLSSITLNVHNVTSRYIIELLDDKRNNVFRKYIITEDCKLIFPYLNAGAYSFRITEDKNNNGIFDTGNLLKRIQPEKVILFKLPDGKDIIELPEQTEIEQNLYLGGEK